MVNGDDKIVLLTEKEIWSRENVNKETGKVEKKQVSKNHQKDSNNLSIRTPINLSVVDNESTPSESISSDNLVQDLPTSSNDSITNCLEISEEIGGGTNNESNSALMASDNLFQDLPTSSNDSVTNRLAISQENILETQDATTSVTVRNIYI